MLALRLSRPAGRRCAPTGMLGEKQDSYLLLRGLAERSFLMHLHLGLEQAQHKPDDQDD